MSLDDSDIDYLVDLSQFDKYSLSHSGRKEDLESDIQSLLEKLNEINSL